MGESALDEQQVVVDPLSDDEPLWTLEQLATYLQVPVGTVRKWRSIGYGPRGRLVGRYVRYRRSEVKQWLETR